MKKKNITEAWLEAVKAIASEGKSVKHEDMILKEITNLILEIENPLDIGKPAPEDKHFIDELKRTYDIRMIPNYDFPEYERIFNYNGINQLEIVIEKLRNKPETNSATISLIEPNVDLKNHLPCLCLIDYKIKESRLAATVIYRSHDYGLKALPNLIFHSQTIEKVCNKLKIEPGTLLCHSISAHICYLF